MRKTIITSDTHFYHKNILKFQSHTRLGIETVDEMNEKIIGNWNDQVSDGDLVYHLGDFSFGKHTGTKAILERLKGDIILVRGNHDGWIDKHRGELKSYFVDVRDYLDTKINDIRVVMFHFPIVSWHQMGRGAYHLFGHCHGGLPEQPGRSMDVGIDSRTDMRLWEFDEIHEILGKKPIIQRTYSGGKD